MSSRTKYILFAWLLTPGIIMATSVINGIVTDSISQKPLSAVNITIENSLQGAQSDTAGRFSFKSVSTGNVTIIFDRLGYDVLRQTMSLKNEESYFLNIKMTENPLKSSEILVEGNKWISPTEKSLLAYKEISPKEIISSVGNLEDPIKSIQNIPGVNARHDYTSQLFIRGSSPDQTAIALDGLMLYNPYRFHFLSIGGLSIFNPDMINQMNVTLGGFSSAYGNKMSGLLSIHTIDGGSQWKNKIGVNLHSFRYLSSGPILRNLFFIVSVRRTYYDWILNQFAENGVIYPHFKDIHSKITWNISPKHTLRLYGLYGEEGAKITNLDQFTGEFVDQSYNGLISLSFESNLDSDFHFKSISAYQSNRDTMDSRINTINNNQSTYSIKYHEWTSSMQLDWEIPQDKIFSAGIQYFNIDQKVFIFSNINSPYFPDHAKFHVNYERWSAFLESHIWLTMEFQYKLGFRWDYFGLNEKHIENPRFSFQWQFKPNWFLSGNWGIYSQLVDSMNEGKYISENKDLNEQLKNLEAQKLFYYAIAVECKTFSNFNFKIEGFYKKYLNLPIITKENIYSPNPFSEETTSDGEGYSTGFELLAEYDVKEFKTWIGYTFLMSKRLNNYRRNWIPTYFDQRHWVISGIDYNINEHWKLQTIIKFGSGYPHNKIIGWYKYLFNDSFYPIGEEKFYRPEYFRWDARITYKIGNLELYFEIINILDTQNFDQSLWQVNSTDEKTVLETNSIYMFPRFPTFGLIYQF